MTTTNAKKLILQYIAFDIQEFSKPQYATYHRNGSGMAILKRHEAALQGWVRPDYAGWNGGTITPAEKKTYAQALKDLENKGQIVCERDSRGRIQWVALAD